MATSKKSLGTGVCKNPACNLTFRKKRVRQEYCKSACKVADWQVRHKAAKAIFVKLLAGYLVGDQVRKSIDLQMGVSWAAEWSKVRSATPLFGYPTVAEAEADILKFLS